MWIHGHGLAVKKYWTSDKKNFGSKNAPARLLLLGKALEQVPEITVSLTLTALQDVSNF